MLMCNVTVVDQELQEPETVLTCVPVSTAIAFLQEWANDPPEDLSVVVSFTA